MAAALDLNQFNQKVGAMLGALPDYLVRSNAILGRTALSLVRSRLINQGEDATGKKFGSYSSNPLPTFFFTHKGLGSGADKAFDAYVKKQRKLLGKNFKGVSYEEFRRLNNRPTDFVTLSFTGETLNDLDVLESKQNGRVINTIVGSKNSIKKAKYKADGTNAGTIGTEDVLEHLANKYGDLLALSEKEEQEISLAFDEGLQKFINQYLG